MIQFEYRIKQLIQIKTNYVKTYEIQNSQLDSRYNHLDLRDYYKKTAGFMRMKSKPVDLFDQALRKVEIQLRVVGMQIMKCDINRSVWERLRLRWFLVLNTLLQIFDVGGQMTWLAKNISSGKSFVELTNIAPCFGLILFGVTQSLSFIWNGPKVCQLLASVRVQLSSENEINDDDMKYLKNKMKVFYMAVNSITLITGLGIFGFGINPFVYTAMHYYSTGEVRLKQPFIMSYPFDTTDIRFYVIAYVLLMWSAVTGVLTVMAPYYLCYACSTFIIYLFHRLIKDIKQIIPHNPNLIFLTNEEFKEKTRKIINRHRKLIECVNIMEVIYSGINLFNVVTSSILICLTGFNVMAIEDLALMLPFLQFLLLGLVETYFLCYYGDMIIRYSEKIADAVYNCQWYRAEASIVKNLFIVANRAQKPCKLTALKFSDINFITFTKILSTSWTYFAILKTMYKQE